MSIPIPWSPIQKTNAAVDLNTSIEGRHTRLPGGDSSLGKKEISSRYTAITSHAVQVLAIVFPQTAKHKLQ